MDMFVDTSIGGFQIILNITKVNKYFVAISSIILPKKYIKFNVHRKHLISQLQFKYM